MVNMLCLTTPYPSVGSSCYAAMQASDQSYIPTDLLTGADLGGGEDADSDLSHPDESASGDSVGDWSSALNDEEQEDEDAASNEIVTAKGNHKRREDKKLLPTEDKYVALTSCCVCTLGLVSTCTFSVESS